MECITLPMSGQWSPSLNIIAKSKMRDNRSLESTLISEHNEKRYQLQKSSWHDDKKVVKKGSGGWQYWRRDWTQTRITVEVLDH